MPSSIPSRAADTSAEAERVQIELLRATSVSRRLHLAWSLSATVIGAARRGLSRRLPAASTREIGLKFVETHYGPELAAAVRADLERRARDVPTSP
ncbi:MAG: hypothetical protein ACRD2A_12765 [Vicinamibacterales bacterium]